MNLRLPAPAASALRAIVTAAVLLSAWWLGIKLFGPPPFILPGPERVFAAILKNHVYLFDNALVTLQEILLGLLAGTVLGVSAALLVASSETMRRWLLPLLVLSQVLPVFAIAPLLVVWFGYGLASKIVMTTIIIFFPITSAFQDGLRRTDPGLLDLARLHGASRLQTLSLLKVPSALPSLASGLRVAIAAAPIGAVVGEWVGASSGLGYVMLNANARAQTDVLFAALLILGLVAAVLWFTLDAALARLIPWSDDRRPS
jgi:putative hydroxymethylpyrimidine transport system permease protein